MIDFDLTKAGPLLNGKARAYTADFLDEATEAIADEAVNLVQDRLRQVLQHPTGFYQAHIRTERQGNDIVVTDGHVVYGPWLEGTSSRNNTTRFKGYRHWRLTRQRLQERAGDIAQRVMPRYLDRLNGGR